MEGEGTPTSGRRKRQTATGDDEGEAAKRRKLDEEARPPAANGSRPAIKLAALKGTKWDKGDIGDARMSRQPSTPTRGSPSYGKGKGGSGFGLRSRATKDGASDGPVKLRGILTPSKNRGRRLKSVYFEDLPKVARSRRAKEEEEDDDDDDDEIRCGICLKPDSRPPNEIILCDNCDFASHQVCSGVPVIPEGDWLCKSCSQEEVVQMVEKEKKKKKKKTADEAAAPTTTTTTTTTGSDVPEIANLDQHLRSLQRVLLDRCCGRRRIRMIGLEECYDKARQLVEQTVVAAEGNSMLLIGPRGCGKTTMMENMMVDLSREHRHLFHVVRLSGFIHTDDKVALKEIWRQLGKEMEVEDELVNRTNYADTLASLLALLSHPSEITGRDEGGVTSQSVVFIIDEFDMFAGHGRQTLLYNLLDIAQSRKAPIAVVGCTTRLDVVEMLEKRVKSRFSHRCIYVSPPRSLAGFWQVCRQGLVVEWPDVGAEGIDAGVEGWDEFHAYWSRKIEELYEQRSFQDLLRYHFYTTKSAAAFMAEWVLPLTQLSATKTMDLLRCCGEEGDFSTTTTTTTTVVGPPPRSRLEPLLSTLSDLDLGMLIAAARLDVVADTSTVNFAMAYDEYGSLVARQRLQSATSGLLASGGGGVGEGVAAVAWERLISLGLLASVTGGAGTGKSGGGGGGQGGLEGRMWRVEVKLEEIPGAVELSPVLGRWCREM
ncbi:hypothetical protein L249_4392 [Ophiocordyceps polyrhachis-furcata BCC 54312]|uniref:Origin recognition complex subunit 4 n=1 Tax=Ophiocordyceps polyrhachis-furcata BCC 54312 TaxID=1330021 RepID=A0A367L7L2_9HYPO|nr:hypothetical protein L249_4392 [Ophiocordyceps polyrhachis-furcata BCC 54312]